MGKTMVREAGANAARTGVRACRHGIARHDARAGQATQAGPLVMGGVDDEFTGRADLPATLAAMAGKDGARIVLTHFPDIFPQAPVDVDLVLGGHTHCGQITWPRGGSPSTMSDCGNRYACGVTRQHGKVLVTGAGLGTNLLTLRLFTHPESG